MKDKKIGYKLKLLLLSLLMLIAAMAFNAGLNAASFKKVYTTLLTNQIHVIGLDAQVNLERAVRLGKLLQKFVGIDQILQNVRGELELIESVFILLPDDRQIAGNIDAKSNLGPAIGQHFRDKREQGFVTDSTQSLIFEKQDFHHQVFPIQNRDDSLAGLLVLQFSKELIDQKISQILASQISILLLTTFVSLSLIAVSLVFISKKQGDESIDRRLYIIILLTLTGAQIYFSIHSANTFRKENIRATLEQVTTQSSLIKRELETKILSRGIGVDRLRGIEKRFVKIIGSNTDIKSIAILDLDGNILNMADIDGIKNKKQREELGLRPAIQSQYTCNLDLIGKMKEKKETTVGYLQAIISQETIHQRMREIYFDSLTIILLSIMFIVEMKFFLEFFLRGAPSNKSHKQESMLAYKFARPAAFLLLFAWALPISFIPLKMQMLYEPLFGLSKNVVLGLPISVEMLAALITALLAGSLSDRHGWHIPFLLGVILSIAGSYLSAQAATGLAFIGYRGLAGLGYGFAWMAIQGFIFHNTQTNNRALGYSTLVAGIFSGHICGTAIGAMVAERMGYDYVFVATAILLPVSALFTLSFMRHYMVRPKAIIKVQSIKLRDWVQLLTDKSFLGIMMLSVVPFSICQVGLLYYAAPIYLDQQGISQSSIGRVLMVYGLSVIFIAPRLSRLVDRSQKKSSFIVLGGLVGSAGLISLYFVTGLIPVLVAVFTLGLSSSLAGSAQPALALKLKTAQRVGAGRSMSIQRAADKLGQMGGPLFIGALVASVGIERSIAVAGVTFLIATLLFLILVRE